MAHTENQIVGEPLYVRAAGRGVYRERLACGHDGQIAYAWSACRRKCKACGGKYSDVVKWVGR